MARKYINREEKKKQEISAEDEWQHITDLGGKPNLEIKDVMDIQERNITLSREKKPKTTFEIIKEEARNAMDAAGNTGQYIRFVKLHIDKQKNEIDKMKKIKEKFEKEIELLKHPDNTFLNLEIKDLEKFDVKTISQYLQKLLEDKGVTKKKLNVLKDEITAVESELKLQEDQIENLNKELESKRKNEKEKNLDFSILKSEVDELVEKYGADNLSKFLESVKS